MKIKKEKKYAYHVRFKISQSFETFFSSLVRLQSNDKLGMHRVRPYLAVSWITFNWFVILSKDLWVKSSLVLNDFHSIFMYLYPFLGRGFSFLMSIMTSLLLKWMPHVQSIMYCYCIITIIFIINLVSLSLHESMFASVPLQSTHLG